MRSDKRKINKIYSQIDKIATKGKDNFIEYCKFIDDSIDKSDYDNLLQCLYYNYNIDIEKLITVDDVKNKTWDQIRLLTNLTFAKKIDKLYNSKKVYQMAFDIWSEDPNYIVINLSEPLSITYSVSGTSSGISITKNNTTINISVTNPKIYEVILSKATWSNGTPSNIEKYQEIKGVTQSTYRLDIPTTHDTEWLIKTKERSTFNEFNYNLSLSTNKYLGQIEEIDDFNNETKYYIKNRQYARITKTRRNYLKVSKIGISEPLILEDYNYNISSDDNMYNKYVTAINFLIS